MHSRLNLKTKLIEIASLVSESEKEKAIENILQLVSELDEQDEQEQA